MNSTVTALTPVLYVHQLDASREFYRLLGFSELRAGSSGDSHWSYLHAGDLTVLIAAVRPALIEVELPLLVYVYLDHLTVTLKILVEAGIVTEHVGYPDHAPGGEARVIDPDGNIVLLGQRVAIPEDARVEPTGQPAEFELIRLAAEAVSRRGGAPARCRIGRSNGDPCSAPAEVKLADPWGDSVWGCRRHAAEALVAARGAFVATEDGQGIGQFLRHRRARR